MLDNPEPPSGRRSRLEDEVLEILYRSDRPPSFFERVRASLRHWSNSVRHGRTGLFGGAVAQLDSGLWLAIWVAFGVLAYVVRDVSPLFAHILVILCLALLILAIVRSFRHPDRGTVKRWRGRDVDISPSARPLWLDRVFRGPRRPPKR